jgi:serine/threonine protein kinase
MTFNHQNQAIEEIDVLKQVNHYNVMRVYEVIEDRRKLHIVSDFYTGGELLDRILQEDYLTEKRSAEYM